MTKAPYNFIPFSDRVLLRYTSISELPPHNAMVSDLYTGSIQITMTAASPVFVSNGNRGNPDFFRAPNGSYSLPASTVRGMVRQNMQILGFGLIRTNNDIDIEKLKIDGTDRPLTPGLPETHRKLQEINAAPPCLDYPYSVLGFAEKNTSYRSRVSFEDLAVVGSPKFETGYAYLRNPQPKFAAAYLAGGTYESGNYQLRGHKLYWLKDTAAMRWKYANLRPVSKGTAFCGGIRFQNLHADELGLLLWCLRLEDGCYQSIGQAKPYGYGRMKLNIDRLHILHKEQLYRPVSAVSEPESVCVDDLIRTYQEFACDRLELQNDGIHSLADLPVLQDYFFMKSSIRDRHSTRYMDADQFKGAAPLPTVRDIRLSEETNPAPEKEYDPSMLLQRFGSVSANSVKRKKK